MDVVFSEPLPAGWDDKPKGCWAPHPDARCVCELPPDGHEVHKRKHPNGTELECWRVPSTDDAAECENCHAAMGLKDGLEPPLHGLCHPCASSALDEALETFAPFYLHAKALRDADVSNLAPLKVISQCGASALVGGALSSAIEFFEKYGVRKTWVNGG